jgi:hypothetical protein
VTDGSHGPTNDRIDALPPAATGDALTGPRADLARAIPRRARVTWVIGIVLAAAFAVLVTPAINAERWLAAMGVGEIVRGEPAPITVRVPPFAGYDTASGHTGGGGVLIAKGEIADRDTAATSGELSHAQPHGRTSRSCCSSACSADCSRTTCGDRPTAGCCAFSWSASR